MVVGGRVKVKGMENSFPSQEMFKYIGQTGVIKEQPDSCRAWHILFDNPALQQSQDNEMRITGLHQTGWHWNEADLEEVGDKHES